MKPALEKGDIEEIGNLLDVNWNLKKQLSSAISNNFIDEIYDLAKANGAIGGKLLGAGGSGFLLFCHFPSSGKKIEDSLSKLRKVNFKFSLSGSTIIHE